MTATLWRRLIDVPAIWIEPLRHILGANAVPDTTTTTADLTGAPLDVAKALSACAESDDTRVLVAVLSEAQARHVEDETKIGESILRQITHGASTPVRQRVVDLSDRLREKGPPSEVVILWNGRVRPEVTSRTRTRRSARFTLDDDSHAWIRERAKERGIPQSDVVNDLILAARDRQGDR